MVQFKEYAQFYDLLYKDKPYYKETLFIDSLIQKYQPVYKKSSILDLACGTGKHLTELSKLGYGNLYGSDISTSMVDVANTNNVINNTNIKFYNYSFQECNNINSKFDVVISMFSAVNYITSIEDQLLSFKNIRSLLKEDAIFIFDFWNGNAVVRDYSPLKVLRKENEQQKIIRISETTLNLIKQDAFVKFSCMYSNEGNYWVEFQELHHLHYYFFAEMNILLKNAGFEVIYTCPFMKLNDKVDPYEWNISIVAKPYNL